MARLALQQLLTRDGFAKQRVNPLAAKKPHFEGKAKSVADAIKKYGIDPDKADPVTV